MSRLMKSEEKLLKRVFTKRKNDLKSQITSIINHVKDHHKMSEVQENYIEKYQKEINEIVELEKKILEL